MATEIVRYEFVADVEDAVSDLKIFKESLADVENSFKAASPELAEFQVSLKALLAVFKLVSKAAGVFASGVGKAFQAVKKLLSMNKVSLVPSVFSAIAGVAAGSALAKATEEAIDYVETLNLFRVAMKESLPAATDFVNIMSEMYGLDPKTLMDSVGIFYEMGYAVNMPDKAARQLSTDLTALTSDVASLFNYDFEQVQQGIISGIRGQSRAVIKYGMDLRATTVEQYALSKGIKQNYETMNEASREILRYLVILEQTKDSQGDFAKTIEQPANQLRIFKEQMQQFGRAVGQFVIAPLAAVLPVVNGVVMAFRVLLNVIAAFLGVNMDQSYLEDIGSVSDAVDDIGTSAEDSEKAVKRLLAPFDELNILQKDSSKDKDKGTGTAIDPKILKLLDETEYKLKNVRMEAIKTRDAILDFFGVTYNGATGEFNNISGGFMDSLTKAFEDEDYSQVGIIIGEKLNDAVDLLPSETDWENIKANGKDWLGNFLIALNSAIDTFSWHDFGTTVGSALGTAFDLYGFALQNFDFENFAKKFGEGLSGFFNEDTLESGAKALAEKLRVLPRLASGFIEGFQWTEFGENFGNAITTFFDTFSVSEYLDAALSIITHLADAMALSIQTAFDNGTFGKIGTDLAKSLQDLSWLTALLGCANTIINALGDLLSKFVKSFSFSQFGTDLANNLNTFFTDFKESEFYPAALEIITKIQDGLINFIYGIDWTEVGETIADVLEALQWDRILLAVASAIGSTLVGMIKQSISSAFDDITSTQGTPYSSKGSASSSSGAGRSYNTGAGRNGSSAISAHATGGVTTGPTVGLLGEGLYDEAIVPLGNSPQLAEMLEKFANVAADKGSNTPVVVKVYIGDKEWDAFTYESSQRGEKLVGKTPVKEDV